ncbi:uncharacterized protein LOC130990622 [Salvia miltiorrhiza]|uniref:uncharacterized protein LOC130990622 n=1 Tax=Salvia miltiorrhiza TaxID=226208 RepID=UPI0025AD7D29|nr:uncharacterized protein LOC130990622 [Salvia miltiorrhiza]
MTKESCGIGIYIRTPLDDELQFAIKYEQRLSNNEAEYEAVVKALQFLAELGAEQVRMKSDSQLVVQQLLGEYDVREDRMIAYYTRAQELMAKFQECHIEQISWEQNNRADLLARMASTVEQSWTNKVTLLCEPYYEESQQILTLEERDDWRSPIVHFLKMRERLNPIVSQRCLYHRYCLINDQLYKRSFTHPLLKILSPEEAQYALDEIHQGYCGNHVGYKDLLRKIIKVGFYWPQMGEDAKKIVKKCIVCQKHAPKINVPGETMGAMYATAPFDKWGIDIVGKLPTASGEWTSYRDLCPQLIHKLMDTWNSLIAPYICDGLKKRLEKSKDKWVEKLDGILWAHRTSPKTATEEAPFTLVYGSIVVIPADVRLTSNRILHYEPIQNEELRQIDLDLIDLHRDMAVLRAAKYKTIINARFDKKVTTRRFEKGDLVLKRVDALKKMGKFDTIWEGPFVVTEVLGEAHITYQTAMEDLLLVCEILTL